MRPGRRLGLWSAIIEVFLGTAYIIAGLIWLALGESTSSSRFQPSESFLIVFQLIMLLSAPPLVVLMAAVHSYAPRDSRVYSLAALAFTILFAAITSGNRFIQLTVVRQIGVAQLPSYLHPNAWPAAPLALDILAWGPFLGLALLFASRVFSGGGLQTSLRVSMTLGGAFCVAGALGPALGDMRLALIGVVGWVFGIFIACALLAILFARQDSSADWAWREIR